MEGLEHDAQASRPSSPVHPASPPAAYASASASAFTYPPAGHALRRSVTVNDAPPVRRRPTSMISLPPSDPGDPSANGMRRRSSTLSDFSMTEARRSFRDGTQDILNPSAANDAPARDASSIMSSLPLAFALLPALSGVLFEGGGAVITDVMLLGLVFIFLRYTITQPWQWYHEAQEVRIRQEVGLEHVCEEDSEVDGPSKMTASVVTLDEVPEENPQESEEGPRAEFEHHGERASRRPADKSNRTSSQEAAVNELYIHEVLALLACFLSPIVGAYLLHTIRAQLTRPSEGLMTDFNITVFLLAAELRPMSHALTLIQARTLHLQRIVQSVPVRRSTTAQLEEMLIRLAQLELRADATEEATAITLTTSTQQAQQNGASGTGKKDTVVREVRNAIQPELDALNRAVRRYEKKATVLAIQTDSRLNAVDTKLDDAISLAAAAVKQSSRAQWGFSAMAAWIVDKFFTIFTMPYHLAMFVIMWPFRTIASLCFKGHRPPRDSRSTSWRSGRYSGLKGSRNGSDADKDRYRDRVPSRISRRYSP
ncbi:hypothetical protein N0V93_004977 [Gnomoniopsis smithogilvyi]|uniref:Uncharacterized protein n=1 Tax=Gnomoniopsis smithogilvyi TaxID=1191159 RepID=A0A9W8YUP8_9PEZI|nr:hypothetical protein N0V93_004977 [Gnomoniopsis smithogilvyi]